MLAELFPVFLCVCFTLTVTGLWSKPFSPPSCLAKSSPVFNSYTRNPCCKQSGRVSRNAANDSLPLPHPVFGVGCGCPPPPYSPYFVGAACGQVLELVLRG